MMDHAVVKKRGGRDAMSRVERFRMLAFAWFSRNVVHERSPCAPKGAASRAQGPVLDWFANSLAKCAITLAVSPLQKAAIAGLLEERSTPHGRPFDECADWLGLSDEEYRVMLPKEVRHARERRYHHIRGQKWPWPWR
jgi:hypothetical protein